MTDGPYLRWLRSVKEAAGEELWEMWCESRAPHVDPWIRALGILPFEESPDGVRLKRAREEGNEHKLVTYSPLPGGIPLSPDTGPKVYRAGGLDRLIDD